MNSTHYAAKELRAMTVGCTKIINGKSATRWSADRWEIGTFGKRDAVSLAVALVALGFEQ